MSNATSRKTVVHTALILSILCASGCQDRDEKAVPHIQPTQSHQVAQEKKVVVPPAVQGAWKSIKVSVIDKKRAVEGTYLIPVGGSLKIPGTKLEIRAEYFLPAFVMEGTVITSESNELKNPGAKIVVTDDGSSVFKGWLFSRFPNTHSFMHPTYGFTLVGVIPAGK